MNRIDGYRSGFVALIGAPNSGKSTLLNRILGQKISITSPRPQTTRNRILGVKHLDHGQVVFVDTPGVHQAKSKLNQRLVRTAQSSLSDINLAAWIVDGTVGWGEADELIRRLLKKRASPVLGVLNKIDLLSRTAIQERILELSDKYPFHKLLPVSALHGQGVGELVTLALELLPEGPPFFPQDMVTDQPERVLAAEIVREKVMRLCFEEVPYAVAVTLDAFKEKQDPHMIVIQATIHVERESQKGILIGKGGSMLKRIGVAARKDLEALLGTRVYLELWVRIQKNWRQKDRAMQEFGY